MIKICIFNTQKIPEVDVADIISRLPFGESEKQRLMAINNPTRRRESLGALLALNYLLKRNGGTSDMTVIRLPDGKPVFSGDAPLPFSLSHSCGMSVAAIGEADDESVGVDIEIAREGVRYEDIAKRFFDRREMERFVSRGRSVESFMTIWTEKEARSKASGIPLLEGKDACADKFFVSRLTLDTGAGRATLAICSKVQNQMFEIYMDCEETL